MKRLLNSLSKKDKERNIIISKKGITLIALVITIIILIILAGITINLTIGEKGIFNKAKYAKEEYLNSQEKEKEEVNDLYSQMMIATNNGSQITIKIEELNELIEKKIDEKTLEKYPIGSIYISTTEMNPSEFIGGTWESYGQGRTLVGAGTGTDINSTSMEFAVNTTGGEYFHTLTIEEMPSHSHRYTASNYSGGTTANCYGSGKGSDAWTQSAGGSQSHNNIQPYIVTYMWKRVS